MSSQNQKISNNPLDIFVIGARKGWNIAINNLMPNVLMAYVIAEILRILGIMAFIGKLFGPVMALFGLPGEAATVLMTAWLSSSASVGVAVNLINQGTLNGTHATILLPAIFLIGSQLQYMGRLLGVADVPKKYWPLLMLASIINAAIAMFIMRFFA
ncbi:MAG: YjiG family protein [Sporomusaceae bacterium]|nr:YjiG family protein [Sporomusaceae bacterium]